MTYVTHAGSSTVLWKFDTSTRRWQRVQNGAGPGARRSHSMASVGLDLWLHGGVTNSGEGDDVCGTEHTRRRCCCSAETQIVPLCTL
jgi:hypothetical protein